MYPLITKDPVSGGELIVTRLECPESGIVIEGRFSLGWIGRLTREQLEFVEMLLGDEPVLDPPLVYYQRLLAQDTDEATELVQQYLKEHPLEQIYDQL